LGTGSERERVSEQLRVLSGGGSSDDSPGDAPAWDFGPFGYDPIDDQIARGVEQADAAHQLLPEKHPRMSEDAYVELSLRQAGPFDSKQRRVRAERYARWRYRGYCAGIVASLV